MLIEGVDESGVNQVAQRRALGLAYPPGTPSRLAILRFVGCALATICTATCAHIPSEAPELSAELGHRITAIENSHLAMLHRFMDDRRERLDDYFATTWVPAFAKNLLEDPYMKNLWEKVKSSNDPKDQLEFLVHVGPKVQKTINEKRVELMKPLDDVEHAIERRLRDEYEQALAVNNSLTSFLQSASDLDANRDRYVAMAEDKLGFKFDIEAHLMKTAELVQGIVDKRDAVQKDVAGFKSTTEAFKSQVADLTKTISGGSH